MIEKNKTEKISAEKLNIASQWKLMRWKFYRHKVAVFSLILLSFFYFVVIFGGFISPYNARQNDIRYKNAPPQRIRFFDEDGKFHFRPFVYGIEAEFNDKTFQTLYIRKTDVKHPVYLFVKGDPYQFWGLFTTDRHLFGTEERAMFLMGTDRMGRDLLSRIIYGGRLSLTIGLVGIACSFLLGITIGGISGYYGGRIDRFIQRTIETIRSIPTIPLWMVLSIALPPYWSVVKVYFGIVIILSLIGWTGLARVVRGKFMALRKEDFVMAAILNGASEKKIIFQQLLPSFSSHIIASLTLSVPGMILGETALSFLGLGLQAPAISWGVLLKDAQQIRVLANTPWILFPGLFVIITILAFNFVGDGIRDAADPYSAI
ncbi:MAG: ABC transporter permease [Spirochaetales bacterium]|nr:ABC transporter permease [Spirochaetales bacterium]